VEWQPYVGEGKQFAFVEYATHAEAVAALGLNQMAVGDRALKVEMSKTVRLRKETTMTGMDPTPGGTAPQEGDAAAAAAAAAASTGPQLPPPPPVHPHLQYIPPPAPLPQHLPPPHPHLQNPANPQQQHLWQQQQWQQLQQAGVVPMVGLVLLLNTIDPYSLKAPGFKPYLASAWFQALKL
jgi:hypothetical protein